MPRTIIAGVSWHRSPSGSWGSSHIRISRGGGTEAAREDSDDLSGNSDIERVAGHLSWTVQYMYAYVVSRKTVRRGGGHGMYTGLRTSFYGLVSAASIVGWSLSPIVTKTTHICRQYVQLNMSYCIMKIRPQSQCSTRFMHYHRGHRCVTCVTPQSTLRPVPERFERYLF